MFTTSMISGNLLKAVQVVQVFVTCHAIEALIHAPFQEYHFHSILYHTNADKASDV